MSSCGVKVFEAPLFSTLQCSKPWYDRRLRFPTVRYSQTVGSASSTQYSVALFALRSVWVNRTRSAEAWGGSVLTQASRASPLASLDLHQSIDDRQITRTSIQ